MILFGDKTVAFFDVWSIEHFISGISFGALVAYIFSKYRQGNLSNDYFLQSVFIVLLAYVWEALEHYLEVGLINAGVTHWFRGVEFWGNRLITDPLLLLCGALLFFRYQKLGVWARIFSCAWLFTHIWIFPDSMFLQDKLALLLR